MSIIGDYSISDTKQQADYSTLTINYAYPGQNTVNVSANTVTAANNAQTNFTIFASANDYIVISPDTNREIVKRISNVVSNTVLTLESSVSYIGNNKIRTTNTSANVLVLATSTELIANDVLTYMNGSYVNSAIVLSVLGNVLTTNTTSVANADIYYSVTPRINNQSYKIISV
jgi:hypothetical protein